MKTEKIVTEIQKNELGSLMIMRAGDHTMVIQYDRNGNDIHGIRYDKNRAVESEYYKLFNSFNDLIYTSHYDGETVSSQVHNRREEWV